MIYSYDRLFMPVFRARQFQTDGRIENIIDSLNVIGQEWVGLCLTQGFGDEFNQPATYWQSLTEQMLRAVRRLHRRKVYCDLILPGAALLNYGAALRNRLIDRIYGQLAGSRADTIWVDDTALTGEYDKKSIVKLYRRIAKVVGQSNRKCRLGLLAGTSEVYRAAGISTFEAADMLCGDYHPLVGWALLGGHDYNRIDILKAARRLALGFADLPTDQVCETVGFVWDGTASGFHKSSESVQMLMNLAALYGARGGLFDLFDRLGEAPGNDNLFLQGVDKNSHFVNKINSLTRSSILPQGFTVLVDPEAQADSRWSDILLRMGLPVRLEYSDRVDPSSMADTTYIMTGQTPALLSDAQLEAVFRYGVLLDVQAAAVIQNQLKRADLLGVRIGGKIADVQTELLSDHGFATENYGHESLILGQVKPSSFRRLTPTNSRSRPITALIMKDAIPNEAGIVLFDDSEQGRRCAILPCSLSDGYAEILLTEVRQRHFQQLIQWLYRGKLPCVVENTPDLVPFLIQVADRKRAVLALLNVGFDWAVQSRIQLADLPFKLKRIRQLDDSGKLFEREGLEFIRIGDYQYLQLEDNTAVPPMQMVVIVLEG